MRSLIVGGSSGLGLSLANRLSSEGEVIIAGRTDPRQDQLTFLPIDLSKSEGLFGKISALVKDLPPVDLLAYVAGFYQEGTITDLTEQQILEMVSVGLLAPVYFSRELLAKQEKLDGFIAITSTSQWTPRLLEPVYTAVKAGLGMFTNSLSLDERVKKTLVAAPAGMATKFWEGTDKDTSTMLGPDWVADQILSHYSGTFRYKYARFLREPARVEVVEERK